MVENTTPELHWMFGFGANLNVTHIEEKKKLKIYDHSAAKVVGWQISFPKMGWRYAEPAFASAYQKEGSEIHGLAFAVTKEDKDRCNSMEAPIYVKEIITLELYDGRKVEGQIYTLKE